ncbi:MAG: VOC family protein [Ostreibacterium sp.]
MMKLDHFVLTVADINKTVEFYCRYMGFTKEVFAGGRIALNFAGGKINLHEQGKEFEPKAQYPTSGSADLCFICEQDINELILTFSQAGIDIIEGPVMRTGSQGSINSFYCRDPDNNLIEVSNQL